MFNHYKSYLVALIALISVYFASCKAHGDFTGREYMPDMAHSNAYEYYTPSRKVVLNGDTVSLSADGKSARKPVAGTIARGYASYTLPNSEEGYAQAGSMVHNPYNVQYLEALIKDEKATPKFITEGKELYNVYCAVCHGEKGQANGVIVANGKYPAVPPSYFIDRLLELPEGQMFHVLQYGKNLMGSYAGQLNKDERWKVIAYIKDMQAEFIKKEKKLATKADALQLIVGNNTYKHAAQYNAGTGGKTATITAANVVANVDTIKTAKK